MAYVTPSSILYLLKNVPLDVEHKHTWYFGPTDYEAQLAKFLSYFERDEDHPENELVIYDSQYIRYEEGSIKVPFPIAKCIVCNYMVFGNPHFEGRWFYAFITNVEYVSNDCTRIYYEIDELQTWICFMSFEQCYIERQHQTTDTAGDNLIPEGLELGDYVFGSGQFPLQFTSNMIVVASTYDTNGNIVSGNIYNNIYSGIGYTYFGMDSYAQANTFLDTIQNSGTNTAVVSVFMCPTFITQNQSFDVTRPKPTAIGTYTPRNKKLLTYPYTFCYVTNLQGTAASFPWEYFSTASATFAVQGAMSCSPQVVTFPKWYKGNEHNVDEAIIVGGYPQCAYNTDSFKAWVAQTIGSLPNAAVNLAADSGSVESPDQKEYHLFSGNFNPFKNFQQNLQNPLGGKLPSAAEIAEAGMKRIFGDQNPIDLLKEVVTRYIKPPQSVGCGDGSVLFSMNMVGFLYAEKHIREEFAQIIDQYFDRYGYAIHRNLTPNIHARKGWTYIKTRGCVVNGALPAQSAKFIEHCMDSGLTFWNPSYTMGNYNQDNTPGGV